MKRMFIPRLYYPSPLSNNETVVLDKTASHYLEQVIRLRPKDKIILFNGKGGEYHGEIAAIDKTTTINILSFNAIDRASTLKITLGQAIARGDRMDLVIQKATELGVHNIAPLKTERSLVKLDENRQEKRLHHWQQIIISACEQSGLNQLPHLNPIMNISEWAALPFEGLSLMLDPYSDKSLATLKNDFNMNTKISSIRIAIGSESGWSETEKKLLIQAGFQNVRLGPRILRTETAGLVAISLLQMQWGDLKD